MRPPAVCMLVVLLYTGIAGNAATGAPRLVPPVDGPIIRPFEPPLGPYGPGHRGVDYAVPTGTRVRAAAPGTVSFAGPVAGSPAVTIAHEGGLQTTYSILSQVLVHTGEEVVQGEWIGLAGVTHPGGAPGLHFGVKVAGTYADPAAFLGAIDITQALHLAPLVWRPASQVDRLLALPSSAGDFRRVCSRPAGIAASLPPPDRNIAVAIAGISSRTDGGAPPGLYSYGPARLGYPSARVFRFSYRGIAGPRLHQPYARTDTYGDLRIAAHRLRRLLLALAKRFPGAGVDLFAHSQGGLVARLFLDSEATAWDPRLPRVDHLVTLATPNEGAPLAAVARDLAAGEAGGALLRAGSRWARSGGPLPDPLSTAVAELRPGSALLRGLARQDVAFGTRVLTLASPFDVVVPPNHAAIPGELNRVVAPNGLFAHSAILRSESVRRIEYSFLRGGPIACPTWWDRHGSQLGAGIDWLERHGGALFGRVAGLVASPWRLPFPW